MKNFKNTERPIKWIWIVAAAELLVLAVVICLIVANVSKRNDDKKDMPSETEILGDGDERGSVTQGDTNDLPGTPIPTDIVTPTPSPTATLTPTNTPTATPTDTPTATPTDTPTPTPVPEIRLSMAGDVLMHTRIEEDCRLADGTYDYSGLFKNTKDFISSFDLSIVNQEVIIAGAELGVNGYPDFNASFELSDALADAGFDVVLHASNHCLDKGKTGLLKCLDNWKTAHPEMKVLGIYSSQEEYDDQICIYEKDGIRVAILNFTYGTNGIAIPSSAPWCVGPLLSTNPEEGGALTSQVTAIIDRANELADFVIVCPHWGVEYSFSRDTNSQYKWNRIFYNHGVDLVIGTHPHVIQPMVIVNPTTSVDAFECRVGEDGMRTMRSDEMLVYYSLGNYVNWTEEDASSSTPDKLARRMLGGIADVTLGYDDDGNVVIKDFGVTPIVAHVETGKQAVTVYKLADYTEELAARNEIRKQEDYFSLDYCLKKSNDIWSDLCR